MKVVPLVSIGYWVIASALLPGFSISGAIADHPLDGLALQVVAVVTDEEGGGSVPLAPSLEVPLWRLVGGLYLSILFAVGSLSASAVFGLLQTQ